MNPNGRVPTIEDDGFVLWESNAIVRYLSAKHGAGTLWPNDPRQTRRRRPLDGLDDEHGGTGDHACFLGPDRTPAEKRDLKAIDEGVKKLAEAFQVLEQSLEGRDHVAGKSFTMGDIPLGTFVYRWNALDVEAPEAAQDRGLLRAACQQRASYKKHVMLPLS